MTQDKDTLALGLVQMTSAATHAANIATLEHVAQEAAAQGCEMIALPEVAGLMNRRASQTNGELTDAARDPFLAACKRAAKANGIWIHVGSTPVTGGSEGRLLNHSELIDPDGRLAASYDKIHLFDVQLEGRKPIIESSRFAAGAQATLAQTPWGLMGLTICYDLRFPALYRHLAQNGARVLFVPSAFLVPTGEAHWEVLLRARAIENGAFVVAAAQVGHHEDGRDTYGHSMVVDPWGVVLADMGEAAGLLRIDLDLKLVHSRRAEIPSLTHDRPY